MKNGFDNDKYLKIQSEHIKERIAHFGDSFIWNLEASFLTITTPPEFFQDSSPTVNYSFSCSLQMLQKSSS